MNRMPQNAIRQRDTFDTTKVVMSNVEPRFNMTIEYRDSGVWHGWLLKKYLLTRLQRLLLQCHVAVLTEGIALLSV